MNGPEHYRVAERLIAVAHQMQHDSGPGCGSEEILAEAQVHATLALAAAVGSLDAMAAGVSGAATGRTPGDAAVWRGVLRADGGGAEWAENVRHAQDRLNAYRESMSRFDLLRKSPEETVGEVAERLRAQAPQTGSTEDES